MTSSAGRMFDAVACIAGLRLDVQYDGQAAAELEAAATDLRERYSFRIDRSAEPWVVDTRPVFREILGEAASGVDAGAIAGKFHSTMARVIIKACDELAAAHGVGDVALSGGVFQNVLLLDRVAGGLEEKGLRVHVHRRVPCNDGGVSLGQAVVAARRYSSREGSGYGTTIDSEGFGH